MPNISFSRNERLYLQSETAFGTIPNSSGAASVSGSNCCRFIKSHLAPEGALYPREDKTGTRSSTPGVAGRKTGKWSVDMSMVSNGAAGVVPDCDPILQSLFGSSATIVAATSCTYSLADIIKTFSMWSFRTPASMMQRVGWGCVAENATFSLGQDVAKVTFDGPCGWVLDSYAFAGTDATGKAGLTAFPVEPASPVTNGSIIAGFTGLATLDGDVIANIRTAQLKIATSSQLVTDTFGSYYATSTEGGVRRVTLSFSLYDQDDASTQDLYAKAIAKTPINVSLQIGAVAGNIWTFNLKGVQLATPTLDDGQLRWSASFGESPASASAIANTDELTLVLT